VAEFEERLDRICLGLRSCLIFLYPSVDHCQRDPSWLILSFIRFRVLHYISYSTLVVGICTFHASSSLFTFYSSLFPPRFSFVFRMIFPSLLSRSRSRVLRGIVFNTYVPSTVAAIEVITIPTCFRTLQDPRACSCRIGPDCCEHAIKLRRLWQPTSRDPSGP
jgi:hypothetical protein